MTLKFNTSLGASPHCFYQNKIVPKPNWSIPLHPLPETTAHALLPASHTCYASVRMVGPLDQHIQGPWISLCMDLWICRSGPHGASRVDGRCASVLPEDDVGAIRRPKGGLRRSLLVSLFCHLQLMGFCVRTKYLFRAMNCLMISFFNLWCHFLFHDVTPGPQQTLSLTGVGTLYETGLTSLSYIN